MIFHYQKHTVLNYFSSWVSIPHRGCPDVLMLLLQDCYECNFCASSARARPAQLTQTHCLGGRSAPLPEAPHPRSCVLPSGASRSNGLKLDLSPGSVRISCRLARFCLVSAVIHRQGQKPRAAARPFCSHLYSDSIQGSIRASQTTGRTGEVDNRAGLAA